MKKNFMQKHLLVSISIGFLLACSPTEKVVKEEKPISKQPSMQALDAESELLPVLYHQQSAEYKALCYQAFNVAKRRVDELVEGGAGYDADYSSIIMDIDETVLDNSPYNAYLAMNNLEHNEALWNEWVNLVQAKAIPGAREFIEHALSNGLKIYFISNRSENLRQATIQNLLEQNIPFEEESIFLAPPNDQKKEDRRKYVESLGHVFLYIGDNLADFSSAYESEVSRIDREKITDELDSQFGIRYIIIPNLMYGGWKDSLKEGDALNEIESFK